MNKFLKIISGKQVIVVSLALLIFPLFTNACKDGESPSPSTNPADTLIVPPRPVNSGLSFTSWAKNQVIYEVNLRQYSQAGTFAEFQKQLPRLKEMGVGILWIMPIQPIGIQNRVGSLGSYYAVQDYHAVNSEFGTMADFTSLVNEIHKLGMSVILDWVPNHTSRDNVLLKSHSDWFEKDASGNYVSPSPDYKDVIKLDYAKPALRKYMINAMKYWVGTTGIDGFRVDMVSGVRTDFWPELISSLKAYRSDLFMLAEGEGAEYHDYGFDMTYGWNFYYQNLLKIASNTLDARSINSYLKNDTLAYKHHYRMYFTTNHDINSWEGTTAEKLGNYFLPFSVLIGTFYDMPLIYSGQEAGLSKRLQFFEKDPIDWTNLSMAEFYKTLNDLKRKEPALWNGADGGRVLNLENSNPSKVCSYIRQKGDSKVLVVLNFSSSKTSISFSGSDANGAYREVFTNATQTIADGTMLDLNAFDYKVFVKSY